MMRSVPFVLAAATGSYAGRRTGCGFTLSQAHDGGGQERYEQQDRERDQRGHDWPFDKNPGEMHD